jgi:nitroreductase
LIAAWLDQFTAKEQIMEALEAIFTRRSIRAFTAQPIDDKTLQTVLAAAMSAPSAANHQPWQFVVVCERAVLDQIPSLHPYAAMCRSAALAILVCGDMRLDAGSGYWVQDCAAATENLLLAAHAQGLGGVWVGVYPREERIAPLRRLLDVPEQVTPFALVPLGYPTEPKPREDRFRPERVHLNHW